MKIVLFTYCFYPDPMGGTEVYVEDLAVELVRSGHEVIIAVPSSLETDDSYKEGIKIVRFPVPPIQKTDELYRHICPKLKEWFSSWIKKENPDVFHFHATTRGQSVSLFETAKQFSVPIIVTYHTPTVSCLRGSLMFLGKQPCDGFMNFQRCAACILQKRGIPEGLSRLISHIPLRWAQFFARYLPGKLATLLGMAFFTNQFIGSTQRKFALTDKIVAVCEWVKEVLHMNNVPANKIFLSRQGTMFQTKQEQSFYEENVNQKPLVIGYLGRIHPSKGLHILVSALNQLPSRYQIRCEIYGIVQSKKGEGYKEKLERQVRFPERVFFCESISHEAMRLKMQSFHLLAVPSLWLESGPLVVLEAFALGIPILGSRLGGIAELVRDGENGLLIEPGDIDGWALQIERLYKQREELRRLHDGIIPPKTMSQVAQEMLALYDEVLQRKGRRQAKCE